MFPELTSISIRRRRLGLTQKKLSAKAEISQSLLTKIERGLVIPNYKTACNIFEILDEQELLELKAVLSFIQNIEGLLVLLIQKILGWPMKLKNIESKPALSQIFIRQN